MSVWSYVHGTIEVSVSGSSQAEKTYYLDTVLKHLPRVSGSEENMKPYVILKRGYDEWSSLDEFEQPSNLGEDSFCSFCLQNHYLIVLSASLRNRDFSQTMREFAKWFYRLAKRVRVEEALVKVSCPSYEEEFIYEGDFSDYWDSEETVYSLFECRADSE